ncbi:MAG: serine endoprotease DegQ [Hyphomicrobium sp.]|nr:MAG: serine endoprotease DegQ [Hyphomicrobium sp.]
MIRQMHSSFVLAAIFAALAVSHVEAKPAEQKKAMTKLEAATSLAPMLARVLPGVVSVLIEGQRNKPVTIEAAGSSGSAPIVPTPVVEPFQSGGSGVIVDAAKGIIITNQHVIVDATSIHVQLSDGRVTEAKLVGADVGTDVAVLQIPLKGLTAVPFGDSDRLRIGDFIAAVGNPFGLEGSASQGIVSALMRSDIGYEVFEDFIQIDAAVNPGNSGGALVDIEGRLVGINTATGAQKLRTQGIAFAIPINMARAVADELIRNGTFRRGVLGFLTENLNFEMAQQMNLTITRGAAVKSVFPNTPAAEAGIKKGDVIVAIAGKPVRGHSDYVARVSSTPIGQSLKVELVGTGGKRELTLMVSDVMVSPMAEVPPMGVKGLDGLSLGAMLPGFKAFGLVQGARVLNVGDGVVAASGLKVDDVITKVDMATVRTPQDFFDTTNSKMGRYRLEVFRDGRTFWIWLTSGA